MTIVVTLNGHACADSFLIAPDQNRTFSVPLGLRTDDGSTVDVTLKVIPNGANIVILTTALAVGPEETFVEVHATSPSSSRGDTVLQVLVDDVAQSSCPLTAITNLKVWFKGRFQARFATAGDPYNEPLGSPAGWTFAVEGEPPFVPADSVANSIDKPVGREIRFNDPVALRSHVPPVGVNVVSVTGRLATGAEEEFVFGDPVVGLPVNLGPNSYFAGNMPARGGDALPAEQHPDAFEPIALFEFHIGNQFSGKPLKPEDRPITDTDLRLEFLTPSQLTRFNIKPLSVSNTERRELLLADFNALQPDARTGTAEGRNLKTRMDRMGSTIRAAWLGREWFRGLINNAIQFDSENSAVLSFLQGFDSFRFSAALFNFHADELCGQVLGYISSAEDEVVDPFEPDAAVVPAVAPGFAPPRSRTVDRNDRDAQLPPDIQDRL